MCYGSTVPAFPSPDCVKEHVLGCKAQRLKALSQRAIQPALCTGNLLASLDLVKDFLSWHSVKRGGSGHGQDCSYKHSPAKTKHEKHQVSLTQPHQPEAATG